MGNDESRPSATPATPQQVTVQLPQRDTVTNLQIQTLLGCLNTVTHAMHYSPKRRDDDSDRPQLSEANIAAENTFINVCGALDSILQDKGRWSFDAQTSLENSIETLYEEQIILLRERSTHLHEMNRPHRLNGATMGRLDDGSFICFLGDINNLKDAIMGVGQTPAEAQKCFDMLFNGEVPSSLTDWLTKPKNAKEQLDGSGDGEIDDTSDGGDANGANR